MTKSGRKNCHCFYRERKNASEMHFSSTASGTWQKPTFRKSWGMRAFFNIINSTLCRRSWFALVSILSLGDQSRTARDLNWRTELPSNNSGTTIFCSNLVTARLISKSPESLLLRNPFLTNRTWSAGSTSKSEFKTSYESDLAMLWWLTPHLMILTGITYILPTLNRFELRTSFWSYDRNRG